MKCRTTKEPIFARWILSLLSKYEEEFVSCGEIGEEYKEMADEGGSFKAHLWYWAQVLYAIPSYCKHRVEWSAIMIRNYIKIALKNIKRHKGCSLIYISGLGVGMSCFILIYMYVSHEFSYDKYHNDADDIYRVETRVNYGSQA